MRVKLCSSKSTLVDKSLTKALGIKKSITVFFVCFTYFSMWLGNILQMDFLRRRRNFFKFCTFQCRESIFNFRTTNISGGSRNYRTRHSHSHNTHSNVPSSPIFFSISILQPVGIYAFLSAHSQLVVVVCL